MMKDEYGDSDLWGTYGINKQSDGSSLTSSKISVLQGMVSNVSFLCSYESNCSVSTKFYNYTNKSFAMLCSIAYLKYHDPIADNSYNVNDSAFLANSLGLFDSNADLISFHPYKPKNMQ